MHNVCASVVLVGAGQSHDQVRRSTWMGEEQRRCRLVRENHVQMLVLIALVQQSPKILFAHLLCKTSLARIVEPHNQGNPKPDLVLYVVQSTYKSSKPCKANATSRLSVISMD